MMRMMRTRMMRLRMKMGIRWDEGWQKRSYGLERGEAIIGSVGALRYEYASEGVIEQGAKLCIAY